MHMITLENTAQQNTTALSNIFIDYYMPEANGEFVKIYIYLLRILSNTPVSFSLEQIADTFHYTERDILRALKYWEQTGLILLEYNTQFSSEISKIRFQTPEISNHIPVTSKSLPDFSAKQTSLLETESLPVDSQKVSVPDTMTFPSTERVQELKEIEEIQYLLHITEDYLKKTLTVTEIQNILFFYENLRFSVELITYLIEYCVTNNHPHIQYIHKVALSWAENQITTKAMAEEYVARHSEDFFKILKFFGISNRAAAKSEISTMNIWLKEYGFSMELIQEACNRTIIKTGQASFPYAHQILTDWHNKNVDTIEKIQKLDEEHKKKTQKKVATNRSTSSSNAFNRFPQRKYNFEEYEKLLLKQ